MQAVLTLRPGCSIGGAWGTLGGGGGSEIGAPGGGTTGPRELSWAERLET
jgi:hypothetical protein